MIISASAIANMLAAVFPRPSEIFHVQAWGSRDPDPSHTEGLLIMQELIQYTLDPTMCHNPASAFLVPARMVSSGRSKPSSLLKYIGTRITKVGSHYHTWSICAGV